MKLIIVVAVALVACAAAEVAPPVEIVHSNSEQTADGGYVFGYESKDGIYREEVGEVKEVLNEENKPQKVVVVRGSYRYTNPDGQPEVLNYFADETGYHAEGASIPKVVV